MTAHGLLWGDGPPDLRDADVAAMADAVAALPALGGRAATWVGEAGAVLDRAALGAQAEYLQSLLAAARAGVVHGRLDQPAPLLPGHEHTRHALNWQRAWRQAEDEWLRGR